MKKTISNLSIVSLLLINLSIQAASSKTLKWHPGHYIFVSNAPLTKQMLTLPNFRGVQKFYTWRDFEKEKGVYDFSSLKADLEMMKQYNRQLVVQLTYKSFTKGKREIPDYITGDEYGGGVYTTHKGSLNPVIWNKNVIARFEALIAAFGKEFDQYPNLEAVNLPETATSAPLIKSPQVGVEAFTEQNYFKVLKQQMSALRNALPNTVVIQYLNFPQSLLDALTDYAKEIGVGMGGPDVYPREDAVSDPKIGIYRLYTKLAGTVPMGAAVQVENYSVAKKKRTKLSRGEGGKDKPIVITAEDEIPIPVREHLQLAKETLKLNYLFWANTPDLENVKKMLAEPDLVNDPAGGLITKIPPKAFLK